MEFITLNTIVTDLLNIIRGANIASSEPISKRQLEDWVHQYRALLLKRDIDKGKKPNPDYIQEISNVKVIPVELAGEGITDLGLTTGSKIYRTELEIPKTIDLNFTSGFTYIGTPTGDEIQLIPEGRSKWQRYKKYTDSDRMCFLRNGYIYLINSTALEFITIRGIFEIPPEVERFINPIVEPSSYDLNSKYPIPANMVPTLKELILSKELNIEVNAPTDIKNDSKHNPEQIINK